MTTATISKDFRDDVTEMIQTQKKNLTQTEAGKPTENI